MAMLKRFFKGLDEYLPADVFTMIIEEFESDKPFMEKVKSTLKINVLDFSVVIHDFRSDRPLMEKLREYLP